MKRILFLTICLGLLLSACKPGEEGKGEREYDLYFRPDDYTSGAALCPQRVEIPADQPQEEALLTALLEEPARQNLRTPFPPGVELHSWTLDKEGILHVNLSEEYGGLSGMDLTLADYSIALTLCQLDTVKGVSITVETNIIPFRYHQLLRPEDVFLTLPEVQKKGEGPTVSLERKKQPCKILR